MDPNQPQYSAAPQYGQPAAPAAAAPAPPATPGGGKTVRLTDAALAGAGFLIFLLSFGTLYKVNGYSGSDGAWNFWHSGVSAFVGLAGLVLAGLAALSLFMPREKEILHLRRSHLNLGVGLYIFVTTLGLLTGPPISGNNGLYSIGDGWALILVFLLALVVAAAAVADHLDILKAGFAMPAAKPAGPANPYQGGYAPGASGGGYAQPGGYPQAAQPGYGTQPATGASYGTPAAQPQYGQPAAQPAYGQPAAQPQYGQPAAQPAYGQPAAQPAYGQPAAQPQYGQPASYPPAGGYPQASSYPQTPAYPQPATYPAAPTSAQPASAQPASGQPNSSIAPPPAPDTMQIPGANPGAQPQASYPQQPPQQGDSLI